MGERLAARAAEGGMSFILPNLDELGAQYQGAMRPEDDRFGNGIADWTITYEWDPDPKSSAGKPIWGCMCSPSILEKEGVRAKLTNEDIAAKRAHIVVRVPKNVDELKEPPRTIFHEQGHILLAALNLPRDKEEEIMHSLDHVFSKLSPEQATALARAFQDPMARAYRAPTAKEGDMPDATEQENKDKPDKEAPKMQEGARDAAAINADIANADPSDAALLAKLAAELRQALIAKAVAPIAGNATAAEPVPPPVMGMKPEDAYARAKREESKKAVKTLVDNLPGLDDKQKKYLHGRASVEEVNEALEAMPRAVAAKPIELPSHPAGKGGAKEDPFAREMAEAENDPVMRAALNIGSVEKDGVQYDVPGRIIYIDGTENLRHMRAKHRAKRSKAMEAQ
jgi:hypothetical protein